MVQVPAPIVLVSNLHTASGHSYADQTGISYEFPVRYGGLIMPGSPFVYYRSREGQQQPHYFGAGVIGPVRPSQSDPTRLECEILDYRPFERAIAFRDKDGAHLEASGGRRGYYQPGVRRITEAEFAGILNLASAAAPEAVVVAGSVPPTEAKFGTSEAARKVEEYAVSCVRELLEHRFRGATVRVMPRNNPGYDIRVTAPDGSLLRYAEVKGTALPSPVFFISEGERRFSERESRRYTLFVAHTVNLAARTHVMTEHDGEVTMAGASLKPVTWSGRLLL